MSTKSNIFQNLFKKTIQGIDDHDGEALDTHKWNLDLNLVGVVANLLGYGTIVNKFELQLRYYFHFHFFTIVNEFEPQLRYYFHFHFLP